MSEEYGEKPACKEFGRFSVCVVPSEDMGKKIIVVRFGNEEDKCFEKTEDLTKYLNKKGVAGHNKRGAFEFVNTQFRIPKKLAKSTNVDAQVFGQKLGAGKGESKEV